MAIFEDKPSSKIKQNKSICVSNIEQNSDCAILSKMVYDTSYENNIRPKGFNDYIGQDDIKVSLKVSIDASVKRNVPLDHILFYGPPGLGKTTLAQVIAYELKSNIRITSAPTLERPRDIIGILMNIEEGDILFIDEIHRMNKITEEILYPVMEDYVLDIASGKTQTSKIMRLPVKKFTLIGATTKVGAISGPLRDRFGIIHRLEFYNEDDLSMVAKRTAGVLKIKITNDAAYEIARRSRGTPRITNRFVKRICDYAIVNEHDEINANIVKKALKTLNVDDYGLDSISRKLLEIIITKFDGGPVGIETLAASLCEDVKTIEEVYEPFLIQKGLLERTRRGRCASKLAYKHLNIKNNKCTLF